MEAPRIESPQPTPSKSVVDQPHRFTHRPTGGSQRDLTRRRELGEVVRDQQFVHLSYRPRQRTLRTYQGPLPNAGLKCSDTSDHDATSYLRMCVPIQASWKKPALMISARSYGYWKPKRRACLQYVAACTTRSTSASPPRRRVHGSVRSPMSGGNCISASTRSESSSTRDRLPSIGLEAAPSFDLSVEPGWGRGFAPRACVGGRWRRRTTRAPAKSRRSRPCHCAAAFPAGARFETALRRRLH